jgi:hypothetical protein
MHALIAIGVALYTALLDLYPRAFRREFGSDMIQDFEEATHEAWTTTGWRGVLSLWLFTGLDIACSLPMQWLTSGRLIFSGLALTTAASCAAGIGMLDPRVPYTMRATTPERDELLLLVLATTIVVVIAATIVFSLMFLRPALNRHGGRRRV